VRREGPRGEAARPRRLSRWL